MTKKQNIPMGSNDTSFLFLLLVVIVVCFLLFVPKVSSVLFPIKRQMVFDAFFHKTVASHTINPQAFWEFREFYSPGYYTVDKEGVSQRLLAPIESKLATPTKAALVDRVFLIFTSPHLTSLEALVKTKDLGSVVQFMGKKDILFSSPNEMLYRDTSGNIHSIFIKTIDQMKTANGFFDYTGNDEKILAGTYWLDITTFDQK